VLTVTPAVSSSLIVKVTPVTVSVGEVVADKITVSLDSSTSSSTIDTVPVAEVEPEAIVNAAGSV
jgi:hypothetical protein